MVGRPGRSADFVALVAGFLFGAGAAAFRAYTDTAAWSRLRARHTYLSAMGVVDAEYAGSFFSSTLDAIDLTVAIGALIAALGLLVTLVERIISRRRPTPPW